MDNKRILTEDQIISQMQNWLESCDADMLAHFTGEIFGGKCEYLDGEGYHMRFVFVPDDNYQGAFEKA